jgi:caffeoyl-CoA O-methyltransferase
VLDIGTYTAYSALCLAEGLGQDGHLYTIDNNDETMTVAERFIAESGYSDRITCVTGDALHEIQTLNIRVPYWDIVWMDADKSDYIRYYELCIDKMKPGGLILADNVLWSGKVLDQAELAKDKDTAVLHAFNQMVSKDERVESVLLPIRDGIMMLRKR